MHDQKCNEHSVTFQYSIGIPSTDDPLMVTKVANFEFSNFDPKKLLLADRGRFGKEEHHNP